jgi:hypothetical protein
VSGTTTAASKPICKIAPPYGPKSQLSARKMNVDALRISAVRKKGQVTKKQAGGIGQRGHDVVQNRARQ